MRTIRLWKVQDETGRTSFLWGSHHSENPAMHEIPDNLAKVLDHVDSVYAERRLDESLADRFHPLFEADNDVKAKNYFKDEEFEKLFAYFTKDESLYSYLNNIKELSVKKFTYALLLLHSHYSNDSMDNILWKEAEKKGKKVDGIETNRWKMFDNHDDEQLKDILTTEFLNEETFSENLTTFQQTISNPEQPTNDNQQPLNAAETNYLNERYELYQALVDGNNPSLLDNRIQTIRNANMRDNILDKMKDQQALFVVGLSHLYGEDGLINSLNKKGYTLTPINTTKEQYLQNFNPSEVKSKNAQPLDTFIKEIAAYQIERNQVDRKTTNHTILKQFQLTETDKLRATSHLIEALKNTNRLLTKKDITALSEGTLFKRINAFLSNPENNEREKKEDIYHFSFFKQFTKSDKRNAVDNLIKLLQGKNISLSKQEIAVLSQGTLGQFIKHFINENNDSLKNELGARKIHNLNDLISAIQSKQEQNMGLA